VQAAPQGRAEPSERRASQTDPEARVMKQGDGGYAPRHNVQISTDTAHSIIVGAGVTQEASDQQQLVPAVEEVKKQNGRAADCRDCTLRSACRPGKQGRLIVRSENVPAVAAYGAKMQTEEARAAYRRRAPVAEFSNLWLKAKLGLRQFCVRGLQKARCEVLWACLTYNIQQWFRLRWKVRLNPVAA